MSSFVGFAPVSAPRIVVAVMIDEPTAGQYYGGVVAAPVFAAVTGASLRALGVPTDAPGRQRAAPGRRRRGSRGDRRVRRIGGGDVNAAVFDAIALLDRLGAAPRRITSDSRDVRDGDAFAAWRGTRADGRAFIGDAIGRGAGAVLWEAQVVPLGSGLARAQRRGRRARRPSSATSPTRSTGIRRARCG